MATLQDIQALRRMTGAGIMDCKQVLAEAQGDMERAIQLLRKKGQKVSGKRGDRLLEKGTIFARTDSQEQVGVLLALRCETDFVARSETFLALGDRLLTMALAERPATLEALMALHSQEGVTVQEYITSAVAVLGEHVVCADYALLQGELVSVYVHTGATLGSIAVLNTRQGEAQKAAREMALQVAAQNPLAITPESVPAEFLDRERGLLVESLEEKGKPPEMIDKIVSQRLMVLRREHALLQQPFFREEGRSVSDYLASFANDFTVTDFKRVEIA